MSIHEFYPYKTKPESINLELSPLGVELRRSSDGSLLVYESDEASIKINALATIPEDIYDGILDDPERENPPVKLILTFRSIESRHRNSVNIDGNNGYQYSLEFHRNQWRGAVEVQSCLIRSKDNPDLSQKYASRAGALLAWSTPTRILFDEPRIPPGDHIRIIWKNFEESEEWLQRQSDNLFALDTTEETPVIILNQGFPEAYKVLNNQSNTGKVAAVRDATFYMIVHQVWTSLIAEALINLTAQMIDDENELLVLDELSAWQQRIIRSWAPKLYPEEDTAESLQRLITTIRTGNWSQDLLYKRLPEAIQKQYSTWQGFKKLVHEALMQ